MGFQLPLSSQCFVPTTELPSPLSHSPILKLDAQFFRWNRNTLSTTNLHLRVFGREKECFFWGYNAESVPVKGKTLQTVKSTFLSQTAVPALPIPLQKLNGALAVIFPFARGTQLVNSSLFSRSGAITILLLMDFSRSAKARQYKSELL